MRPLPPPLHALLLDMDGTLVDSEPLWHRAETALVAAHGHTLDAEVRHRLEGIATEAAMTLLRETYRIEAEVAALAADLEARLLALLPEAQAKPGAAELLAWAAESGLLLALVSNSSHTVIEGALATQPWADLIAPECRFSSEDVAHGKPAPDLYLHAARALGVDPARCLVVEDTQTGVRAARAAGMTCWAVPEPHADPAAFRPLTPHLFDGLPEVLTALQRLAAG